MSRNKPITLDPVYEGSSFTLAAMINRLVGVTETPIEQADLTSIRLRVYDQTDPTTATFDGTLPISSVIFDTPQAWDKDADGYNFLYVTEPDQVPLGGRNYHFEFTFTPVAGYPILETFIVPTIGRHGASS